LHQRIEVLTSQELQLLHIADCLAKFIAKQDISIIDVEVFDYLVQLSYDDI